MKLLCSSRPADDTLAEPHTWVVDLADHNGDYDQALTAARASVPHGWVLLHIQTTP